MVRVDIVISNELGMHARAAARFVDAATSYSCEVWISKAGNRVNGKSIMGILTLAAARGETVTVEVDGENEAVALKELKSVVEGGFGEKNGK
jgi:phosphocarrier protein